jgi:hypothetical protein
VRRDLYQCKLQDSLPLNTVEASALGFAWLYTRMYKAHFVHLPLGYTLLNESGRFVKSGFFISNADWFINAFESMEIHNTFNFSEIAEEAFGYDPDFVDTAIEPVEVYVRLYVATLRKIISFGLKCAQTYREDGELDSKAFFKDYDFKMKENNPIISMIECFIKGRTSMGLLLAFFATCPNATEGKKCWLDTGTSNMAYLDATPVTPIEYVIPVYFNEVPKKDWMRINEA